MIRDKDEVQTRREWDVLSFMRQTDGDMPDCNRN
jgi:hypothetical protein